MRAAEIEKLRHRGDVPARSEDDRHLMLLQETMRALDVVGGLDLVIDVLDAGCRPGKQRDHMMYRSEAEQRRIADAVAHAGIAYGGPERLVPHDVGGIQTDMAEAGHAGIAGAMIAARALRGAHDEFQPVAARVGKRDELAHLAELAFLRCAVVNRMPKPFQRPGGGMQVLR